MALKNAKQFDHRESLVEEYLFDEVRALGGWSIKLYPFSIVGLPDRLVLLPGALVYFLELKRLSGARRHAQVRWRDRLKALGFWCEFVKGKQGVDAFIQMVIQCNPHLDKETDGD